MSLLDNYVDRDVVKHFAGLIKDAATTPYRIMITGPGIRKVISQYELTTLLPKTVEIVSEADFFIQTTDTEFIDRIITLAKTEKAIITIKEKYLLKKGSSQTLKELQESGTDIRIVKDILGAMVVASKKRRNKIFYPITGYEDEALITAAGLAKSKTVGFRNFFVLNGHKSLAGIVNAIASKNQEITGFIVPLKVGINTGTGAFSNIPLLHNKGVVFSGYEPAEIMQSVWMLISQHTEKKPAVVFQRTVEGLDEAINRSRWMMEEVFDTAPLKSNLFGTIPNGKFVITTKYDAFDAEKAGGI